MIMRAKLLIGLLGVVLFLVGCQTAPLGGTKWKVAEYLDPDESDRQAVEENLKEMTVEFTHCGKIVTTKTLKDGRVVVENQDRYSVDPDDSVIRIKSPEYDLTALYRFEGDQLRIHSEKFVVQMDPLLKE